MSASHIILDSLPPLGQKIVRVGENLTKL